MCLALVVYAYWLILNIAEQRIGSGVCMVIDFVSAPWAVIVSFQIWLSWLIQLLIRKQAWGWCPSQRKHAGYILLETDCCTYFMQISRNTPALYISVEPECKIHWKAAVGLQQALGFSWFWVDPRLGGCYWSELCVKQSESAHVSQFAAWSAFLQFARRKLFGFLIA